MTVYSIRTPLAPRSSDSPRRARHCWAFRHVVKIWALLGAIVCKCCCIPTTAPVVKGLWGVTEDMGEGCAELRRRLTLWHCFLLREQHYLYTHTHTHWDYGNAGGLEHKHSPLPDLLSCATVNVMLSFFKVNWELVTFSWWYCRFTFI